jgi:hypothetical protein
MRRALVGSRSFSEVVSVGEETLIKAGFEVRRVRPEERPLDAFKMTRIVGSDHRSFSFLREVMATDFKSLVFIGNNNRPALYREVF